MKTLLPITTALALAGAVNLSPAMAQAPNPPGLGVRNIRGAGRVGPIRIAGDPRRFGRRPQCISAHQPAFVDRVLQLRRR